MRTNVKDSVRFFSVVGILLILTGCPTIVNVPDVVGLSLIEAEPEILRFNLLVGTVTEQYDPSVTPGIVISQSPPAGTPVNIGTAVDLVVSIVPPPKSGSTPTQR